MAKPPSNNTLVIPQPIATGTRLRLDLKSLSERQRTTVMQALCRLGTWLTPLFYEGSTLVCDSEGGDTARSVSRLHSAVTSILERPVPSPIKNRKRFH